MRLTSRTPPKVLDLIFFKIWSMTMGNKTKIVVSTTGFLLPKTSSFIVIKNDTTVTWSNKNVNYKVKVVEGDFDYEEEFCTSAVANELLLKYSNEKNFDNYMRLVDFFLEAVKDINFVNFMELQAANPYLSVTGFQFCVDLCNDRILETHNNYGVVSTHSRVVSRNTFGDKEVYANMQRLSNAPNWNWKSLISKLANDKAAFANVFKFMFVDHTERMGHDHG